MESTSCAQSSAQTASLSDQRLWTLHECRDTFEYCVRMLHGRCADTPILVWDKDDDVAMDFVTCVANIRAHIFQIPQKSRFDVKCKYLAYACACDSMCSDGRQHHPGHSDYECHHRWLHGDGSDEDHAHWRCRRVSCCLPQSTAKSASQGALEHTPHAHLCRCSLTNFCLNKTRHALCAPRRAHMSH